MIWNWQHKDWPNFKYDQKHILGTVKLSKLVSKSTMFLYFRQQEVFE